MNVPRTPETWTLRTGERIPALMKMCEDIKTGDIVLFKVNGLRCFKITRTNKKSFTAKECTSSGMIINPDEIVPLQFIDHGRMYVKL